MSVNVIIGPPGTGKTTALIDVVEGALARGVDPKRIGYVSFTKKAAYEAVARAMNKFGRPAKDFHYFRTMHSLAFQSLGYTRARVMNRHQMEDFAIDMGLDLTTDRYDEEMRFTGASDDDKALQAVNLSRIKGTTLKHEAGVADTSLHLIKNIANGLEYFKKQRGLVDFIDMINQFCSLGHAPELDLLCIDEAQDLSHTQWEMANKLMESANETYIAGDDDQAIFGWAGADTQHFQDVCRSNPSRVLAQSYRVPTAVQAVADSIIGRCHDRVPKQWNARRCVGTTQHIADWRDLPLDGSWLVLGRNAYILSEARRHVIEELDSATAERVKVSTVHTVKGGEADNVVLYTDMAKRTFDEIGTDEEHRVWYVAVTRAKSNLYIVHPRTKYYYEV